MKTNINPPLSNIQVELLRLFEKDIPENHLLEIKKMIAGFLLEKARDKADAIWVEKNYSDEKLLDILGQRK
jgi:hypothetical protein